MNNAHNLPNLQGLAILRDRRSRSFPFRPRAVYEALVWLKANNVLYKHVSIVFPAEWGPEDEVAAGKATGNIRFPAATRGKWRLRVLRSEGKGCGLFAASDFTKGDVITYTPVDENPDTVITEETEVIEISFFLTQ